MIHESNKAKLPIKMWAQPNEVEPGAWEQATNVANHPHAKHHVVLLPDVHSGYGIPIGCVAALEEHISPSMSGFDIGCGMAAIRTTLESIETDVLKTVVGNMRETVPAGVGSRGVDNSSRLPSVPSGIDTPVINREIASAGPQLGTLGGGNHFAEIQSGDDGRIWLMLHSGSRNIGWQIADHYMKLAKEINDRTNEVPPAWGLETLRFDSPEGRSYFAEMNWALEFALANRAIMMGHMKDAIAAETGCDFDMEINIHHNFAALEPHFGENLWVHRKGATQASRGLLGIIPGSQGTASYIVRGLGNPESFESCSHGAGRLMSRSKAKKMLDLAAEQKLLDDQGILHSIRDENDLDEAASAYKDIGRVLESQADLVEVIAKLRPLAVLKG